MKYLKVTKLVKCVKTGVLKGWKYQPESNGGGEKSEANGGGEKHDSAMGEIQKVQIVKVAHEVRTDFSFFQLFPQKWYTAILKISATLAKCDRVCTSKLTHSSHGTREKSLKTLE